ncbi:uncharacterized protein LY89DRAFT_683711 [Mollisia scopiformis]|uniref:Uncharacterized protein n=1 Tax=Mollisia scopiformis TaxID=149040 RepID=A0A194XF95_MOLSC|nr:uncharacterized protein LY89DRAFT_683711 [Mollisia scopiformis]KUJ18865.1 hypothetical protein LY89DRAFT_683711 [Mollisia scopiformis]
MAPAFVCMTLLIPSYVTQQTALLSCKSDAPILLLNGQIAGQLVSIHIDSNILNIPDNLRCLMCGG